MTFALMIAACRKSCLLDTKKQLVTFGGSTDLVLGWCGVTWLTLHNIFEEAQVTTRIEYKKIQALNPSVRKRNLETKDNRTKATKPVLKH